MVSVVSVYDTSDFGSPDPSGLTYDPVTGELLLVDSEVDETPYLSDLNMFSIGADGEVDQSYALTTVTKEPTGIAFNSVTGTLFVTDDDTGMVYEVDRADPTHLLSSFSAASFGATAIEDISAADDGSLYVLDRTSRTIFHTTTDGSVLSTVALPSTLKRPDALAYDPGENVFYVAGGWSADIFKVSSSGQILDTIKVLRDFRNDAGLHVMPKSLAFVPSDDPNVGATLWVGDYGADQVSDGRLFQIQLDPVMPAPAGPDLSVLDATPVPQIEGAGNQLAFTFTLSEAASQDVVVSYHTADGTATAGSDYVGVSAGTAVISAGSTSTTAFVNLINDSVAEGQETFSLQVTKAQLANGGTAVTVADASGQATVIDDDPNGPPAVMVYNTASFGSPDPAGLAYVASTQQVVLVNSEVDETPFFSSINMFSMHTDGTVTDRIPFTAVTTEPTGVAAWHDPATGRNLLFITDDEAQLVRTVDMNNPLVQIGSFSTAAFTARPEDIAVDPSNGHLFIADDSNHSVVETTQDGTVVATIPLPAAIPHLDALAYNPATDTLYVSGFVSPDIYEINRDGAAVGWVTALRDYPHADGSHVAPRGLALVPDSDGSGGQTLWVADYGVDQVADGRLFTIHLEPTPPPAVALSDGVPSPQTEADGAQISFVVSLNQPLQDDVTVHLHTVNGTAVAGQDFVGLPDVTATILAGSTNAAVKVDLINDNVTESTESFSLHVDSAVMQTDGTPVSIADSSGTGTIRDDDVAPPPPVRIIDTTAFGSGDPAGLTYDFVHGTVFLTDSEAEETPYFSQTNLFELGTDGAFHQGFKFTAVTNEPTGVAFWRDAATGQNLLFTTDDDKQKVQLVDEGNPLHELRSFSTSALGIGDPESITTDPNSGHLYIVDELNRAIWETSQNGTLVSSIDMPDTIKHPEAIAYDPTADMFYVSGFWSADIYAIGRDGAIVDTVKTLRDYRHADGSHVVPKGLELVPASDGSGAMDLWVADYGKDQVDDGRILIIDHHEFGVIA